MRDLECQLDGAKAKTKDGQDPVQKGMEDALWELEAERVLLEEDDDHCDIDARLSDADSDQIDNAVNGLSDSLQNLRDDTGFLFDSPEVFPLTGSFRTRPYHGRKVDDTPLISTYFPHSAGSQRDSNPPKLELFPEAVGNSQNSQKEWRFCDNQDLDDVLSI